MTNLIDVNNVMKDNYILCYNSAKGELLKKKLKCFDEIKNSPGLLYIICAVPDVIRNTIKYAESKDQFFLEIPKIRENIFNPEKQEAAQKITFSYNDIHAFVS